MRGAYSKDENTAQDSSGHDECSAREEDEEFDFLAEGEAGFE